LKQNGFQYSFIHWSAEKIAKTIVTVVIEDFGVVSIGTGRFRVKTGETEIRFYGLRGLFINKTPLPEEKTEGRFVALKKGTEIHLPTLYESDGILAWATDYPESLLENLSRILDYRNGLKRTKVEKAVDLETKPKSKKDPASRKQARQSRIEQELAAKAARQSKREEAPRSKELAENEKKKTLKKREDQEPIQINADLYPDINKVINQPNPENL
jgi:hypothetical protein